MNSCSFPLSETLNSVKDNPSAFLQTLAAGLSVSSQFFLNNMIVATGTETLWELAQMPQMMKYFVIYRYITVEAKSKRYLERLERAEQFEWGHEVPQFIFSLLVGAVYCINVPLVIGICAAYFYVATKVYTHQALFVYAQRYEGGGKLMYYLNRTTFTIVYIAATIFSINLGLRGAGVQVRRIHAETTVVLAYYISFANSKFCLSLPPTGPFVLRDNDVFDHPGRSQDRQEVRGALNDAGSHQRKAH